LLRQVAQQNEAPPAEFYCSLEEDVAQGVFGTPQRREFPGEQTVRFCSGGIWKSAEKGISRGANCQVLLRRYSELRREGNFQGSKLSGFCSGSIRNTQSTTCIPLWFCAFSCSHGQGCNTAVCVKKSTDTEKIYFSAESYFGRSEHHINVKLNWLLLHGLRRLWRILEYTDHLS
jgi:hypothetical protein